MEAYILEILNLAFRWLHIVTAIAWIGSSFYFMWLDYHLEKNKNLPDNAYGELWSVHGGGFYHNLKYLDKPESMPSNLHWFKWESYATWISGFCLLIIIYYLQAELYLIDQSKLNLSQSEAILFGLGILTGGWLIYHFLCKLLSKSNIILSLTGIMLLAVFIYFICQIFSDRGAYIHVGAMIGTIMSANVFLVIIPNQKKIVHAIQNNKEVPVHLGLSSKVRSTHNNYLTLPVLFIMMSNHYSIVYASEYNWLYLIIFIVLGGCIRHYFNLKNQGQPKKIYIIIPVLLIILLVYLMAPKSVPPNQVKHTDMSQIQPIIEKRCVVCHSSKPTFAGIIEAPKGITFDQESHILGHKDKIISQIKRNIMPPGNLTQMTDEEREIMVNW